MKAERKTLTELRRLVAEQHPGWKIVGTSGSQMSRVGNTYFLTADDGRQVKAIQVQA